ncbi:leucine-rich repeat protein, partial [Fannyhessea vaginae]|uniref:leucine-rich repeat protein n=1 Tax=Fannyhessea vaginae TaxID=82135 RepID=UPI0001E8EBA6
MESSKKKRNSVLPIIVSVGIATSMGVVASSAPEVAYASSNASSASTATYTDRSSSENVENQVITFKDSVLKSKLLAVMKEQNIIANDAKDITIADAEKLTRANLRNWSVDSLDDSNTIHNLTGLEHFNNLVYLNFSNNKVSNLTPLENLTSLEELYFSGNNVSDLTPLENLFLISLDFSGNQVSDLTPLGVLDSLEDLFFTDNKVSKLDTLQYLHSLKTLDFSKNKVSDLTPLGGLDSLTKLVFDGNKVSDLTPLENLTSLENLLFSDNKVSDLTPLENLTSLKELIFIGNQVSDLSPLENLKSLKELNFIGNQVSDLTPLENLTSLERLEIGNQTIAIDSNDKETTLPVSDVTFTIQGDGNSIGSITNGVFTLSKDLPYSGTISIDFKHDNIKIGSVTASYTGTITLNLNVPKIDGGVTTWAIKAKMKYEADSSLNYQEKKVEKAAIDGTRTTYADGRNTVEVPAQDGLTKVGNVEVTHDGNKTITTTYTVDPNTGELSNPQKHTSMPIGNLTGSTKTEILKGKMKYEADSSLNYQEKKVEKAAKDGKKVTTSVINGEPKVEITQPQDGLTKVGNVEVTHDGNKTITTTYTVDPDTGKLSNPQKHTSMPIGNLTGSTKTEILKGKMKYEADSSLDYNTQKKISDPVDGKKVTTSVINGDSKVEITPAKNGLTKVGNKQVTHDGNKTITTTYTVDPDTGKLTDPKTSTTTETVPPTPDPVVPPTPVVPTPTPNPVTPGTETVTPGFKAPG